jgi:hypothetical protein
MSETEIFNQIPLPPDGAVFSLIKVEKISIPHPFVIMPGHVAFAAKHCGGMLSADAIYRSGVKCGWGTANRRGGYNERCQLSVHDHKSQLTLFIRVPQNRDLNAVEGLHPYLLSIKDKATSLGVEGFAFPSGGQS